MFNCGKSTNVKPLKRQFIGYFLNISQILNYIDAFPFDVFWGAAYFFSNSEFSQSVLSNITAVLSLRAE
jgi:hypothetical protein